MSFIRLAGINPLMDRFTEIISEMKVLSESFAGI
ncbi:hypothetical protein WCLP8_120005 [uncultured Gammaproteobacteria bacterium]